MSHEFVGRMGTATANDATPSVSAVTSLLTANTNATTITNFDDGVDGQLLTVVIGDALTTIAHDSATGGAGPILLSIANNRECAVGEIFQFIQVASIWREINGTVGRQGTATASDATPSVVGMASLVTANANATTITNFDDGVIGQILTLVIGDRVTTIAHDSATGGAGPILLAAGNDRKCESGEVFQFVQSGTKWREINGTGGKQGTATASDATPSVCGLASLVTANAVPTTITNFDDGAIGQILTLVVNDAFTTLDHDAATGGAGPILLQLASDRVCIAGDVFQFIKVGTKWHELNCTAIVAAE